MWLPPTLSALALHVALVTVLVLFGLTAAGHFPAERRSSALHSAAGAVILWGTMLVAALSAAAAVSFAAQAFPWSQAVIAAGLGLLVAPLLLQRLPDRFVDGRRGLLALSGLAAALALAAHRLTI